MIRRILRALWWAVRGQRRLPSVEYLGDDELAEYLETPGGRFRFAVREEIARRQA